MKIHIRKKGLGVFSEAQRLDRKYSSRMGPFVKKTAGPESVLNDPLSPTEAFRRMHDLAGRGYTHIAFNFLPNERKWTVTAWIPATTNVVTKSDQLLRRAFFAVLEDLKCTDRRND